MGVFATFKMLATCTGVPLLAPLVITTAVKLPTMVGGVVKFTVNWVDVAELTEPTAPLFKVTALFPGVVLNPVPFMVSVAALINWFVVFNVIVGMTVATWTGVPLLTLLVVTTAVKMPAVVGGVVKFTVN